MIEFEEFAFQLPLYSRKALPDNLRLKAILYGVASATIDGHCLMCRKASTFSARLQNSLSFNGGRDELRAAEGFKSIKIRCARDSDHSVIFWFYLEQDAVIKVGQYPSLADIANDEAKTYHSVLNKEDASELHKAIGLAAHGVGIGSFVYLRRVFERLVHMRFSEFRETEGWDEKDFSRLRMDEKVEFIQGHIPEFLYENRKMYSILSRGIHELSEDECLKAFEPLKLSIKIILEEDKKKQEELALRKMAADAIKNFGAD